MGKIKYLAYALGLALVIFVLTGCAAKVEHEDDSRNGTSMFVCVELTDNWSIVYHKDTKVMYAVSKASYNRGNFTLLVNADGTPMIYKGD